tara:strand:- start:491 stop:883 length:393 start_codon:yes stop_codon:yes gene_type:complete
MKKLLLGLSLFLLTASCRGYLSPDEPDAKLVTDYFVDYWWELDIGAFNYNSCFILQEEDDTGITKHPIFLKESAGADQELFGTWNFEPPNTFYVYEDGEEPPFTLEVYEMNECWSVEWGSMVEIACPCSF